MRGALVQGRCGFKLEPPGGVPLFFAPVLPEDEWRLRLGVTELSPGSRYLRFFSPASQLSEEQVYRFTHVDQVDHLAWGAMDLSIAGYPGVALGRMVRDGEHRDAAELAVAVVDRAQRHGVGTMLMALLFAAGRRRGIRQLRALVLPENQVAMGWFARLGARMRFEDDACSIRLCLDGIAHAHTPAANRLLLRLAALEPLLDAVQQ